VDNLLTISYRARGLAMGISMWRNGSASDFGRHPVSSVQIVVSSVQIVEIHMILMHGEVSI